MSNGLPAYAYEWLIAVIFVLAFVVYLLPLTLMWEDGYVVIHDNLDEKHAIATVLAQQHAILAYDAPVAPIMNGIPRNALLGGLNLTWLPYQFVKPFTAYWIQYVVVHSVAFAGMYLLLKTYLAREKRYMLAVMGAAFCFAILPFYVLHGLSVAGLPLMLYAFLNLLHERKTILSFGLIVFLGLYTSLVYIGVFALAALVLLWLFSAVKDRKWHSRYILGVMLLTVMYVVVEWHLILNQFVDTAFVGHRVDRGRNSVQQALDFYDARYRAWSHFLDGQYHAPSVHDFVIKRVVPLTGIAWLLTKRKNWKQLGWLLLALGCAVTVSLIYGFERWSVLLPIKDQFPFLHQFQLRTHLFFPLIWYVVFALCLVILSHDKFIVGRVPSYLIILFLIIYQVNVIIETNPEIIVPLDKLRGRPVEMLSYAEFYSVELFDEIAASIGRPQDSYRVVSLGIFPTVALYNGFYTLDGYQNNYPLAYKVQFRKIIADELAKDDVLRAYYDNWGNRVYLFSAELEDAMVTKDDNSVVQELSLDTQSLKSMGGEYLLSAVEIKNYAELGLVYLETFENESSPWRITLYGVQ